MELSDLELLRSWQNGSDTAFELIYKRHAPVLLAHAMRKTNDRAISEEFVQDTFMVLHKQRRCVLNIKLLPAYLYIILKNKVLDHYRHEAALRKYEQFLLARNDVQQSYNELSLETKELERYINSNIENLPQQCKKVFKLSREQQLSNKEIAHQLNISENTVEQHMRKALRLLRTSLMAYARIMMLFILLRG